MAMQAQSAAIDCILGQNPQAVVPHDPPPLASVLAWADIAPEPSRVRETEEKKQHLERKREQRKRWFTKPERLDRPAAPAREPEC